MRAKKGQERTVPWIKLQHSHPAAGVCCLFGPTDNVVPVPLCTIYRLQPITLHHLQPLQPLKKGLLRPLKLQGFFGEVLPK